VRAGWGSALSGWYVRYIDGPYITANPDYDKMANQWYASSVGSLEMLLIPPVYSNDMTTYGGKNPGWGPTQEEIFTIKNTVGDEKAARILEIWDYCNWQDEKRTYEFEQGRKYGIGFYFEGIPWESSVVMKTDEELESLTNKSFHIAPTVTYAQNNMGLISSGTFNADYEQWLNKWRQAFNNWRVVPAKASYLTGEDSPYSKFVEWGNMWRYNIQGSKAYIENENVSSFAWLYRIAAGQIDVDAEWESFNKMLEGHNLPEALAYLQTMKNVYDVTGLSNPWEDWD
jgi:hypothetical protein